MTCTATNSPTRRAAAAPASVAAFTAATSPRTMAVTYPEPIFSQPTSVTLAALTIASEASIIATRPRVSIMPSASPMLFPPWPAVEKFRPARLLKKSDGLKFDCRFEFLARDRDAFRPLLAVPGIVARDGTAGNHGGRGRCPIARARDEQFFHIAP